MQVTRPRRLRRNKTIRDWVAQTELNTRSLILPYFIVEGREIKREIPSMKDVYHLSVDVLLKEVSEAVDFGIKAVLLFGLPGSKDEVGSSSFRKNGVIQKAVKALRKKFNDLTIITDVCLCGFTSHGHCGIVKRKNGNYTIDNDATLKILSRVALSHAESGADFVAPSAMMDGQTRCIREALDKNGFGEVGILSYSAKYASNFYGPFRGALDSSPKFGDRRSYQMDCRNSDEAVREVRLDIEEGVDIVMVKPALAYLDIIYRIKQTFNVPVAAYNVSGEYMCIKDYASGDKDMERNLLMEILISIRRAGADFIITYCAKEVAGWIRSRDFV